MSRLLYALVVAGAFFGGSSAGYFVGFRHGYDGHLLWMQQYNSAVHRAWQNGFDKGQRQRSVKREAPDRDLAN